MAILGTQSLTQLVKVRPEASGTVDARRALLEPALGAAIQARYHQLSPQIDALRAAAETARKGGAILLAGVAGTGKSTLQVLLGRALSIPFPGDEFSALCDRVRDVNLVRTLGGLRNKGRRWLIVQPEAGSGDDFDNAVRRALNGALFNQGVSDFAPTPGRLRDEFQQTVDQLRKQGGFDGIAVLFDGMDGLVQAALAPEGSAVQTQMRDFTEFCRSSRYPVLLVGVVDREMGSFTIDQEAQLVSLFQQVQPVTLLGRVGEWEELVGQVILEHPQDEIWEAVQAHPDQRAVRENLGRIGLYQGTSDHWQAEAVMGGGYPLHPAVLFALPRVALRLASREKTAFTFFSDATPGGFLYFLKNFAVTQPNGRLSLYTADAMFTHFEKAIEQDPANRDFLQAMHKAVQAAGDIPQARRLLRMVFVFQLVGHDRLRARADDLVWALHLGEREVRIARRSLELLVQKGALRYSEATGEFLLPLERKQVHLEESLERSRNRVRPGLDITAILQRHVSLLRPRASAFNARYGTDRGAFARLFRASELREPAAFRAVVEGLVGQIRPYRGDLLLAYVLAESAEELKTLRDHAGRGQLDHPRLILGLPRRAASFSREALEALALERLRSLEPPYCDPTSAEYGQVSQLLESARAALRQSFLTYLEPGSLDFRHQGQVFENLETQGLQDLVDRLISERVGSPPAPSVPALTFLRDRGHTRRQRQVALNHLLSCRGELALRTDSGATGTILEAGLVDSRILTLLREAGNWRYYDLVSEVPDHGLGLAFNYLRQRLVGRAAEERTVQAAELLRPLTEPPHSLTPAMVELLLAAVLWKWPRELGLRRNWQRSQAERRRELLESVPPSAEALFALVSAPEDWAFCFVDAEPAQAQFLNGLLRQLGQGDIASGDSLWSSAGRALLDWHSSLPAAARSHGLADPESSPLCRLLEDPAAREDLRELVEVRLPRALGAPPVFSWQAEGEDLLEKLVGLCQTLDELVDARMARLCAGLHQLFGAHAGGDQGLEWPGRARRWLATVAEDPGRSQWPDELHLLAAQVEGCDDPLLAAEGLVQALGLPPGTEWEKDLGVGVLERLRAIREEVEWGAYRQAEEEEASALETVLAVLKRAGLPEPELDYLLVSEIEQIAWPEWAAQQAPPVFEEPPQELQAVVSEAPTPEAQAAVSEEPTPEAQAAVSEAPTPEVQAAVSEAPTPEVQAAVSEAPTPGIQATGAEVPVGVGLEAQPSGEVPAATGRSRRRSSPKKAAPDDTMDEPTLQWL